MASSLDLTKLLPTRNRDRTIDSLLKNLFNRFLSKPDTVPLYGFVGDQAQLGPGEVQITETDLERQINQLTPFVYAEHATEKKIKSWYDLVQKLVALGIDYNALNQWFNSKSYNLVPPIDLDKFCNFQEYYWIGAWILQHPTLDYTSLGVATPSVYHVPAFSNWGNPTLSPEYYVIARGPLRADGTPIAPQPTFPNAHSWSDWSYSNLWVHRDDLIEFVKAHPVQVSLNTTVQATRPIIEYSAYIGLNAAQTTHGVPIDTNGAVGTLPAKQFMNQLPLFDLYYHDYTHASVTSSIFYYVEGQDQPVDSVLGRRLKVDTNGDFTFGHSLVNPADNSLFFYKRYEPVKQATPGADATPSSIFDFLTIWREGPAHAVDYVKYDTSGSLIDVDKFQNFSNYYWICTDQTPQPAYNPTGLPEYYVIAAGGASDWSVYNCWTHVSALRRSDLSKYVKATRPIIEFNEALESQLIVQKTALHQLPQFYQYVFDQVSHSYLRLPQDGDNDAYLTGHLFARLADLSVDLQVAINTNSDIFANNCFQYNNETYIQGLYNGSYKSTDTFGNLLGYKSRIVEFDGTGNGNLSIISTGAQVTIPDPITGQPTDTITAFPELIYLTFNGTSFTASGSVTGALGTVPLDVQTAIPSLIVPNNVTIEINSGSIPFVVGDVFLLEVTSYAFSPVNYYVLLTGIYRTLNSPIEITTQVQETAIVKTDPALGDGIWTPPPQLEWNVQNETRAQIGEGDLYYHLISIIAAQPNLIGSATGTNNWRAIQQDVGLGGTIKQYDGETALLVSNLLQEGISTMTLLDFAREAYASVPTSINLFVEDVLPTLLVNGHFRPPQNVSAGFFVAGQSYVITSLGTTDFTLIGATSNSVGQTFTATGPGTGTGNADENGIDSVVVEAFKTYFGQQSPLVLSTATPVDDTISSPFYDSTTEIFNLVVTLPYLGLASKVQPVKLLDPDLNFEMLVHHDGHRTQLVSNLSDAAKKLAEKEYVRSPGESTPGIFSIDYPSRPYAGQFWLKTSTGQLFIFNAVSDDGVLPTAAEHGAYAFDRTTLNVWEFNGTTWVLLGNSLDDQRAPWIEVKLDLMINNLTLAIETELYNECPPLNARLDIASLQSDVHFTPLMDEEFQEFGARHNILDLYSNPQIYIFWTKTLEYLYSLQKTYFKIDPLTYVRETWGTLYLKVNEYTLNPEFGRKEAPSDFPLHGDTLTSLAQPNWISADLITIPSYLMVTGQNYIINSIGNTDFNDLGAFSNVVGEPFTATNPGQVGSTGTVKVIPPDYNHTYTFKCVNRADGIFSLTLDTYDSATDLTTPASPNSVYWGYRALPYAPLVDSPVFLTATGNVLTYQDKYISVTINGTRRGFFFGDTFTVTVFPSGNVSAALVDGITGQINGTNSNFVLQGAGGETIAALNGPINLYKTDWAGRQLQYQRARTNLQPYSQSFSHWIQSRCIATDNATSAPDGTLTASQITATSPLNTFISYNVPSLNLTNQLVTFSVFLKTNIFDMNLPVILYLRDGSENNVAYAIFDATTGTILNEPLGSAISTNVDNGWFRFEVTGQFAFNATPGFFVSVEPAVSLDIGESAFLWGAQVEVTTDAPGATSYIPTTTESASLIDYTIIAPANVSFTKAPALGSTLSWDGAYENSAGTVVTLTPQGLEWLAGAVTTSVTPQLYYRAEGLNQLFVQYGRIYGEDAAISINTSLLRNWQVKLGYRFSGMVNTDNLTIKVQDTAIATSAYNIYLKENDFYNSAWLNGLRVQLVQRGATDFVNGKQVPVLGPNGTPGEDWIFRVDNYYKNRTTISWYNYDSNGEVSHFNALNGQTTDFQWTRFHTTTTISTMKTPFLVTGIQNLITFIFGYSDKLEADGWRFNDPQNPITDPLSGLPQGYQSQVEQFLTDTFSGITAGWYFIFNPFYRKVWYSTPQGFVSNLYSVLGFENETTNAILDVNSKQVPKNAVRVFRQDDSTEFIFDEPVYTLHVLTSNFEHVTLFENFSTNTILLYDPFLGQRASRIFMSGQKQANFTGRIDFGGHFMLNQQMKKNIEGSIGDILKMYDTNATDVEPDTLARARALFGYQSKSYFDPRSTSPATQFRFWQGMIANKGTNFSADAFINSASYNDARLDEYWAYKVAQYGDSNAIVKSDLLVQPEDCRGEFARFIFLEPDDVSATSNDVANLYDDVTYDFSGFSSSVIIDTTGLTSILPNDETRWASYSDLNSLSYFEASIIAKMFLPLANKISVGDCFVITDASGAPVKADAFEIINYDSTSASTNIFREGGDYIVGSNPPIYGYPRFQRLNQSVIKILDLGGDLTQAGNLVQGLAYNIISLGVTTDFTLIGAANNNVGTAFVATGAGTGNGTAMTDKNVVIAVTALIPGQTYEIASVGTTDFTLVGASSNLAGTVFTAVSAGTGTGTVTPTENLVSAGSFIVGMPYVIVTIGTLTDFMTVGAPNNNVGTEFIATGPATGNGTASTVVVTGSLEVVAYGPAANWYSPNRLIDYVSNTTVKNDVTWWDPARGYHNPRAAVSLTYSQATDPATYTNSLLQNKNVNLSTIKPWGAEQVGQVWWNTNNLYYKPYADEKQYPQLSQRLSTWGSLSDMSSIEVYEWVKSSTPPSVAAQGTSMNGEPAVVQPLSRTRTWWQRPVAWKYSANPDVTSRTYLQYQPVRLQVNDFGGSGTAILKSGSFEALNLVQGTKLAGAEYSSTTKTDNVLTTIFGTAVITSASSTAVVGSTNGYGDGPGFTNNATVNGFQVTLDQNVLRFRTDYLAQYVLSTSSDDQLIQAGSLVTGSNYTISTLGQTNTTTAGSLQVGKQYVIITGGTVGSFVSAGATNNTPGTVFVAQNAGVGDGTAYLVNQTVNANALIPGITYAVVSAGTSSFPGTLFVATGPIVGNGTVMTNMTDFSQAGATVVNAGNFVSGQTYIIKSSGNTTFALIGAPNNNVGTIFTASFIGTDPTAGTTGSVYVPNFNATGPGVGSGTATTALNTYLTLTHVNSGVNQKLKIANSTRQAGQTVGYNFDALGIQISAVLQVSAPIAQTIAAGFVAGNPDIWLRSSVTVNVPIPFYDGSTTYSEFFSNADLTAQLGWIAWNDPTTNPNTGNQPPLNNFEPYAGSWVSVGNLLHNNAADITARLADPWTWFDGNDYTPYKSSWSPWTQLELTIIEAHYLV